MYVSKVRLSNIRGIGPGGVTLDLAGPAYDGRDTLAGWTVIAGPNGAGKTTLLQGMTAALLGGTGVNWLLRPDERRDWIHREGAEAALTDVGTTTTWIEQIPADDEAPIRESRREPVPLSVEWPREATSVREIPPQGEHSALLRHFWNAAAYGVKPDGWLYVGYGPHRGNRQSSPDALSLLRAAPRSASVVTLFRQDAGLELAGSWLAELELRAARQGPKSDAGRLRDGLLRLLGHGLLDADQQTMLRVEADGLWVSRGGTFQPMRLLGDGHYAALALVLDLLMRIEQFKPGRLLKDILRWGEAADAEIGVELSGVVLIDEPEGHLHPALQQRLGFWLKRHFPRMQFIVTTHSPLICQAADPGGLFRMSAGGQVVAVDRETWAAVANGTVDSAIMSQLFGLESPDSAVAADKRRRLGELESRRSRGGLSEQEEQTRAELLEQLPRDPSYQLDTLVAALLRR